MSSSNGTTRYGALAALMKQRIYNGEWLPGQAVPAESELARHYGVALGTLRQALDLLVAERLLLKRHGRGTFVSSGLTSNTTLRFFRFGRSLPSDYLPRSRIRRYGVTEADDTCRALFGPACTRTIALERVRWLDDRPRVHERIWLPLPLLAPLADLPASDWQHRLYPLYAKLCNVTIVNAIDDLRVEPMDTAIGDALGFEAGHPGLAIRRRSLDLQGRTVEYRIAIGDAYEFEFSGPAS